MKTETHGLEHGPYETFYVCPQCGSTDWGNAVYCDVCGEIVTEQYWCIPDVVPVRYICDNCIARRFWGDDDGD